MMSVRKTLLIGCLLLTFAPAIAREPSYVTAQLALTKPEQSDSGIAAIVAMGMPVPERNNIFLEGQLSSTIINPKQHSMELSYTSLGGYGVYQQLVTEKFALHGKAGLLYQHSKLEQGESKGGLGITFGIGATIHYNRYISYLLEGSIVQSELDLNYISAGIKYRFR